MKTVIEKFLAMVAKIKSLNPAYKQPGDGSDGTCDCIGLVIGAIRRMGLKWTGIHGTNWAARKEFVELKKIEKASDLSVGDVVLRAYEQNNSGWNLPARYRKGGQYYNGDLRDYYHAGVVTSVNPLNITHMSSKMTVDTKVGKWGYYGTLKILYNAAGKIIPDPVPANTPTSCSEAIVVAESGSTVYLRQYPSKTCRTWDRIPVGTKATIVSPGEEWAKIDCGRRKGWYMMSKFLDVIGDGVGKY